MTETTARENVIAKIKALFERTTENGCTEAEAIAAALAAQRLIVRHNVTDEELSERRADEPIVEVLGSGVESSRRLGHKPHEP